jgi:hypothetical protein
MAGIEAVRDWPRGDRRNDDCRRGCSARQHGATERTLQVRSLTAGAGLPWSPCAGPNSANSTHNAASVAGNNCRTPITSTQEFIA